MGSEHIWTPSGTVLTRKGEENERKAKLVACPPDKYIVALAEDVVLAADEWIELMDYDKVVVPNWTRGEVHLLRKVEL